MGTVRVLLFATAREAVGSPRADVTVPDEGGRVESVLAELVRAHPRLGPVLAASRLVRNGEYLRGRSGPVAPGDELAIHPPYSGG